MIGVWTAARWSVTAAAQDADLHDEVRRHDERYYDAVLLAAVNNFDRPTTQLMISRLCAKRRPVFVGKRHDYDDDSDDDWASNKRRGPVFVGKRQNPIFVG